MAAATLTEADRSKEQTRHAFASAAAAASAVACLPALATPPPFHPPTEGSYKFATPSSISLLSVCVRSRACVCVFVCGMSKCGTWNEKRTGNGQASKLGKMETLDTNL